MVSRVNGGADARARFLRLYLGALRATEPVVRRGMLAWMPAGERLARQRARSGPTTRPSGPLVWMHGSSIGETLSVLPVIEAMRALRPELSVLITSQTSSSMRVASSRLPESVMHRYAPLDLPGSVEQFLDSWQPDLLVVTEGEFWPVMITSTRSRGIPIALLNGRLSKRSLRRWHRFAASARTIFESFSLVLARSKSDLARIKYLGAAAGVCGLAPSLKAASKPLPANAESVEAMRTLIGGRPVWVAANVHPEDVDVVLDAHRTLCIGLPDALLVLVPRHPERATYIADRLATRDLTATRRSLGTDPVPDCEVYVADTIGELGLWYRLARVAFIGGSLGTVGGHNPFEAVALDCVVLHGPAVASCEAEYARLDAAGAAYRVEDSRELATSLEGFLRKGPESAARAREVASRARAVLRETGANAANQVAKRLLSLLERRPADRAER